MKNPMRNLMLSAAALAALMVAPKSEAAVRVAVGFRVAPVRSVVPYRVVSGVRFYSRCPGPGYVYLEGGWVAPPHAGAVWVRGHHDRFGIWIGGHWRA